MRGAPSFQVCQAHHQVLRGQVVGDLPKLGSETVESARGRDANARRCPHGRDISCARRHNDADPRLGRPLCGDCYDYTAAVLFNAHAADLWRRFTTYLPRHFARLAGISVTELRDVVAIRYVKVAEYQARGVVHFHAIIRLDAPGDTWQSPGLAFTAAMLCDAIVQAANTAAITTGPGPGHPGRTLRFGRQTDARPVRHGGDLPGTGRALTVQAVANYIAKYATKALDAPGIPDRPIRSALELEGLRCNRHYTQMITTAWQLGGGKLAPTRSRLCKWAHMLGYGGHLLTKSRRYSTTFGVLRRDRVEHRKRQRHPGGEHDPWGGPSTTRSSSPQHVDLRRHRLHHHSGRRAGARLRGSRPRSPPRRHRRMTLPTHEGSDAP